MAMVPELCELSLVGQIDEIYGRRTEDGVATLTGEMNLRSVGGGCLQAKMERAHREWRPVGLVIGCLQMLIGEVNLRAGNADVLKARMQKSVLSCAIGVVRNLHEVETGCERRKSGNGVCYEKSEGSRVESSAEVGTYLGGS
jgi:hypothetical protein